MFEVKVITKSKITIDSIEANNNLYEHIEGVAKLYRISSENISLTDKFETFRFLPIERTNLLFVIAIPQECSEEGFITYIGSLIQSVRSILFIEEPETKFTKAIIHLDSQDSADNFYYHFNTKNFPENKSEFFFCVFIKQILFQENESISTEENSSLINEMSTCPLCIERIENSSSGIETLLGLYPCDRWMNYKKNCKVCSKFALLSELKCEKCNKKKSLWCCLVCGEIGCNRYQEQHAMNHYKTTHHRYSIELDTQRIWDYMTDAWIHRVINSNEGSNTILLDDIDNKKEPSTKEFLTRMENVIEEYNKVLSAQLDVQRKFYETEIEKIEQSYSSRYKDNITKLNLLQDEINSKNYKMKLNEKLYKECIKKSSQQDKKMNEIQKGIEFNNVCIQEIKKDNEKAKQGVVISKLKEEKTKILNLKKERKKQLQQEIEVLYKDLSEMK